MHKFPSPALIALALTPVLTLTGCATGAFGQSDDVKLNYRDYAGIPVDQITAMRGVDSWTPVSRNEIVIWTGINEAYLLKVWDVCPDLQFANTISVTQTGRQISKFEKVRVRDQACPISEIRPVDVKQMRADRKAAKETVPAP
jgi:hypothetical protein